MGLVLIYQAIAQVIILIFGLNGLQAERFYQIEYKVISGSGASQTVNYYGGDFKFKVSR